MSTSGKIIRFIQQSLYEGKDPDSEGYFRFSSKELYEGAEVSASAFYKSRPEVEEYFSSWCNLKRQGNYPEYAAEMLYMDVKYEKGIFMFKRNPITFSPELEHLWALPPLERYFCYDCYDEKHRRRTGNSIPKFDAFPWSWSEERIREEIARRKTTMQQPIEKPVKLPQAPKSDEEKRIESIRRNGGRHLQNFKEENITYAMCLAAVEDDGFAIRFVPQQFRTKEMYMIACKSYGDILSSVPKEYLSKELCERAISSAGCAIKYVPDELKTREMFLRAIKKEPGVLEIVPIEYLDIDFCVEVYSTGRLLISCLPKTLKNGKFYIPLVEAKPEILRALPKKDHTVGVCKAAIRGMGYNSTADAVRSNPELLEQLHTSLYDHETCLAFVQSPYFAEKTRCNREDFNTALEHGRRLLELQSGYESRYSLKHMLQWADVCEIVVSHLPGCIRLIDEDILTYEMCLTAVKKSGKYFPDVPVKFRSKEVCLLGFEYEPHSIKYFPEEHLSYDLYLQAVRRSGYILEETPKKYLTYELCLTAVKQKGAQVEYVPEELLDENLCLAALQNLNGHGFGILNKIPHALRTYSVCLAAVQADHGSFGYVPEEYKTYELCLAAVKKNAFKLEGIPEDYFTEELCQAMLTYSVRNFSIIPKPKLTETICLLAVSHADRLSNTVLAQIPRELITQEICNKAVETTVLSLKDVPEVFVTKEILFHVASKAPGVLTENFPDKFKNEEFIFELIDAFPDARRYVMRYLL